MEEDKRNNIKMNIQISSLDKYIDNKIKIFNLNSILSNYGMNYGIFQYIERINDTKEKNKSRFEFKNSIKKAILNINYNKKDMEYNSFKKDLINFNSKENSLYCLFEFNINGEEVLLYKRNFTVFALYGYVNV